MARTAHVTEPEIAAVADALLAAGLKPTSREVRARLGTGSMGTILKGLQAWKAKQKTDEADRTVQPALEASLFDCLAQERARARIEFEDQLKEQQVELEVLANENERVAAEINSLNGFIESLRTMEALSRSRIRQLEDDLTEARAEAERQRSLAEAIRLEALRGQLDTEMRARTEAEERLRKHHEQVA